MDALGYRANSKDDSSCTIQTTQLTFNQQVGVTDLASEPADDLCRDTEAPTFHSKPQPTIRSQFRSPCHRSPVKTLEILHLITATHSEGQDPQSWPLLFSHALLRHSCRTGHSKHPSRSPPRAKLNGRAVKSSLTVALKTRAQNIRCLTIYKSHRCGSLARFT